MKKLCVVSTTPNILLVSAIALVLSGCATAPRQDAQLEAARMEVMTAHGDSRITGEASIELAKADAALHSADALLTSGRPLSEVDHEAYLADRYARTAIEQGRLFASDARIAALDSRRNVVLLAAREHDARRANQRADYMADDAAAARRSAAISAADADSKGREAQGARADAALSAHETQGARADALASAHEAQGARADAALSAHETQGARADALASAQEAALAGARSDSLERQLADLRAIPSDRGVVITLGDVEFISGHSELQEGSQRAIDRLSKFLQQYPQRTVRVEGFTDSIGSGGYNRALSERRAESVSHALTRNGILATRIQTEGYGDAYPIARNDTAPGRQQNRRVEIIISNGDEHIAARSQ